LYLLSFHLYLQQYRPSSYVTVSSTPLFFYVILVHDINCFTRDLVFISKLLDSTRALSALSPLISLFLTYVLHRWCCGMDRTLEQRAINFSNFNYTFHISWCSIISKFFHKTFSETASACCACTKQC